MSDEKRFRNGGYFASIEGFCPVASEAPHTITVTEEQRQMILVALAELSIARPGWVMALEEAALTMDNEVDGQAEMFEKLRRTHSDPVAKILSNS